MMLPACAPSYSTADLFICAAASGPQVLEFYSSIGCELKDLNTICELNHYSAEVLQGRPFKAFSCRCGWTSGPEKQWREQMEAHLQLEGQELKDADLEHSRMPEHCRHKPYHPPLFHHGTLDLSADVLHLIFINMFAFFFEMTILVHIFEFSPPLREPFEIYVRSIGLPMKVVKAQSIQDMKQSLTGRDAKVVMSRAIEHVPVLLEYAHAQSAEVEEQLAAQQSGRPSPHNQDDEDFTWEGENNDQDEVGCEDDTTERVLQDAKSWDCFRALCFAMRPFTSDTAQYREQRAVEAFNAAALVMREHKRLNPQSISACPHVALCVVPRQMVVHGDPGRRGTDHSESYGASIKDSIHRRCLRRKKAFTSAVHCRRDNKGNVVKTWTQKALSVSRVMQTFRDQAVRERLLRDEESIPYLLRKHYKLASTGFSTVGEAAGKDEKCLDPCASVYGRMEEGRNHA